MWVQLCHKLVPIFYVIDWYSVNTTDVCECQFAQKSFFLYIIYTVSISIYRAVIAETSILLCSLISILFFVFRSLSICFCFFFFCVCMCAQILTHQIQELFCSIKMYAIKKWIQFDRLCMHSLLPCIYV